MANAKKCDRCGKLYERTYTPDLKILLYRDPYSAEETIDLCDKCLNKLTMFIMCKGELK